MKLTSGKISVAILSVAVAVAIWQLWENGRELEILREETARLRADQSAPPSAPSRRQTSPSARSSAAAPGSASAASSLPADDPSLAEFANLPPEERGAFLKAWQAEMDRRRAAEEAAKALAERNKGPQAASYAGGKATGPPDAGEHGGDSSNAWCAGPRSDANQWLKLSYAKSVEIKELAIHETYATGALSRVVAVMPDGKEKVIWSGTEPVEKPPVQRIVQVPPGVRSDQIRIELDTTRTSTWQEIDAVEMIGRDGSRQWAKQAEGSSYWGGNNAVQYTYESLMEKELSGQR